jgi:hypothetical protein
MQVQVQVLRLGKVLVLVVLIGLQQVQGLQGQRKAPSTFAEPSVDQDPCHHPLSGNDKIKIQP